MNRNRLSSIIKLFFIAFLSFGVISCTTYNHTMQNREGVFYITGTTNVFGFYGGWVKKCVEQTEMKLTCRKLTLEND